MPWNPPGGHRAVALPALVFPALFLIGLPLASLAADIGLAVYLIAAEMLAAFGSASEVALERHSRSRVMDMAKRREVTAWAEARLKRVPSYVVTARLARFLGHALLVVGIAWLVFRGHFTSGHTETGELPWGALGIVMAVVFCVTFLLNDVVIRLAVARRPNRSLLACFRTLEVLRVLFTPLRMPLVWFCKLLFRVNLDAAAPSAREELLETVEEGEREGSVTPEEADMIESIIGMDDSLVKDVLIPRPDIVMIASDKTLIEALAVVKEEGYSRLPVYGKDRDDVIGVLYTHDLLHALHPAEPPTEDPGKASVTTLMRKPFFVPENKPISDLLREMRARKVHLAIVLDEFNGTEGLVTIEDLLEEIVGEIEDEYDEPDAEGTPEQLAQGTLKVDGRTPIEEVNDRLAVALPVEDDFETMSGLVFHHLGRIPAVGDQIDLDGVVLTVLDADERTVQSLKVELLQTGPEESEEPAA